jgi:hypothetical protein
MNISSCPTYLILLDLIILKIMNYRDPPYEIFSTTCYFTLLRALSSRTSVRALDLT